MGSAPFRCLVFVLAVLSFALAIAAGPPPAATAAIDPAPFPAGFDYPQPATTVEGWVDGRMGPRMRQHGWSVFAGLNQRAPDGRFIWRTWPTSTQAFPWQYARGRTDGRPVTLIGHNRHNSEARGGNPSLSAPGAPIYPLPKRVAKRYPGCVINTDALRDGPTFQNNGDIMVAGVVYSEAAFEWIRDNRLYDSAVLSSLLPAERHDPATTIAEFPHESIVLKPMWWPVQGTGYTALPVWDSPPPTADGSGTAPGARYAGFEVQSLWKQAVAVTAETSPQATATVTFLHGLLTDKKKTLPSNTYVNAPVVPLERFYHLRYSAEDLAALDPCDRALLDASAMWSYGRPFAAGDALVLIAMHILTKEQPNWTFQTIWWHNLALGCSASPNNCGGGNEQPRPLSYGSQRPANLGADTTWQNYFLVTTYGETQQPGMANNWPPGAGSEKWPLAYNPYIELAATHPIATNCMNCHHRAAWPPRPAGSQAAARFSSYLAGGTNAPDSLDYFTEDNAIFDGLLLVDSMWAVTDRAHRPPGK